MIELFLADGFEEVEAIATLDVIRRCGLDLQTVGIGGREIRGAHGVTVTADITEEEFTPSPDVDAIILPGGMPGTKNLDASDTVREALKAAAQGDKLLCAICAAPSVLGHNGYLAGKRATCLPGFEGELTGATYTAESVTEDGNVITGNGAGSAHLFGEAIAARFVGREAAHQVLLNMQYNA